MANVVCNLDLCSMHFNFLHQPHLCCRLAMVVTAMASPATHGAVVVAATTPATMTMIEVSPGHLAKNHLSLWQDNVKRLPSNQCWPPQHTYSKMILFLYPINSLGNNLVKVSKNEIVSAPHTIHIPYACTQRLSHNRFRICSAMMCLFACQYSASFGLFILKNTWGESFHFWMEWGSR